MAVFRSKSSFVSFHKLSSVKFYVNLLMTMKQLLFMEQEGLVTIKDILIHFSTNL